MMGTAPNDLIATNLERIKKKNHIYIEPPFKSLHITYAYKLEYFASYT